MIRAWIERRAHEGRFPWLPWGLLDQRIVRRSEVRGFVERLRPSRTEHQLIRLGPDSDGGYLLPEDLAGIVACFSPGVGAVADFEVDVEARGIPAFLLDGSVEPPVGHEARFESRFLGPLETATTTTLEAWVERSVRPDEGDLLLQMDVEGAEWEILAAAPRDLLRRFRILIVELHHLDAIRGVQMLDRGGAVLERLLRDFVIVHIHANNCCRPVKARGISIPPVLEVTLLRRDRAASLEPLADPRHPMDRPNRPGKRDRPLGLEWGTPGGVGHDPARHHAATVGGGEGVDD